MNVYLLVQHSHFYSAYMDDRTIVLSCNDEPRMRAVRDLLHTHYAKSGKWLNRMHGYSNVDPPTAQLQIKLGETTSGYSHLMGCNWNVVELDLYNTDHCNFMDFMYELANSNFFLITDFETTTTIEPNDLPLLCMNGVILDRPTSSSKSAREFVKFLEVMYTDVTDQ
jgi:hypothetical protein